ncbi:MAG: DsrE family protein [Gemmatimonadaceae bacterium]|nr:DsrE family protein [Gemmatimonadaceae bacterium]MCC6431413.1 DsrE family protein [Gemmatimonadaceae bacterium]
MHTLPNIRAKQSAAPRSHRARLGSTRTATLALLALCIAAPLAAQAPVIPGQQPSGPVIQSTGMSIKVDNPTFTVPDGHVFKAVFVIDAGGTDTVRVNAQLNTVARFLNVHVRHGYPEERVRAAAVVHGSGWQSLLTDAAYAARFGGKANPSRQLVEELLQHNTQLVLCGQTAGARGVRREELIPGVKVAISAMTALNVLQADGYRFNPW